MSGFPKVEFLWWAGCPSWPKALAELKETLTDLGRPEDSIEIVEIATDEEAADRGFLGSPTILVDGEDIAHQDAADAVGLNCRVYRLTDGRFSPTPDPAVVREALMAGRRGA